MIPVKRGKDRSADRAGRVGKIWALCLNSSTILLIVRRLSLSPGPGCFVSSFVGGGSVVGPGYPKIFYHILESFA
jgi:hypothetical protein